MGPINNAASKMQQASHNISSGVNSNSTNAGTALKLEAESKVANVGVSNGSMAMARLSSGSKALGQAGDVVERLGTLAARANDSTLSGADREALQVEADALTSELSDILGTKFNGQSVLSGSSVSTHIDGAMSFSEADGSGIASALSGLDLTSEAGANAAMDQVKAAMSEVAKGQATVGASSTRVAHSINAAENRAAITSSVSSDMKGADLASEVGKLKGAQVQHKVGVAVAQQQNDLIENALKFFQK